MNGVGRFACDWKSVRLDFLITLGLEFFFFLNRCHFLGECENVYELRFETLDSLNLGLSDKNTGFEAVRKALEC